MSKTIKTVWSILIFVLLLLFVWLLIHNSSSNISMTPSEQEPDNSIEITPTAPLDGAIWPIGSNQSIAWSMNGLSQGIFNTVVFLVGYGAREGVSGSIFEEPSKEGSNSAEYKVGLMNRGGDALTSLNPGSYQIMIRIYRVSEENSPLGYGELVLEKEGPRVIVKY